MRFLARNSLHIVDEIEYLPIGSNSGNLFFQLISACYERCAVILTSNRTFGEWGEVFGDSVVAAALLDRLLHHAIVVQIERSSYRLPKHADLLLDHCATVHHLCTRHLQKRRAAPKTPPEEFIRSRKRMITTQIQDGGFYLNSFGETKSDLDSAINSPSESRRCGSGTSRKSCPFKKRMSDA